ncbi:TAXI family TRAP transporter solute-binding subunit [Microbacterium hydrocarbonoxydans]|uniref:TAXI family TRAP transporter solute-binding subunit n=1 Tax=Microbacterium hydrocarbonoxydans TaxID=273678 RepID=UPI00203B232E|nr:TAXI family TRAP transporter solute-binding subunit [Microbacterium hydrocarbonoxydans]MCM3780288.1 TAXI family TRAP transporter solute-binding subunit [Microbacterium hydrocarbonoxydans]
MRRRLLGQRIVAGVIAVLMVGSMSACSPRSAEWGDTDYEIAGGGANGVYFAYGEGLAAELGSGLDVRMTAVQTAGSVDNLLRVGSGEALLGFAQGDAAADAVEGEGVFRDPLPVQAVARLYDEYLHVVVRADSDIDGLDDLAGRVVSLGAENSGVNVIASRVLDAAEVDPASISDPELGLAASIDALQRGGIDGFFWVGGVPTPGIAELAQTTPVRLLPIEQNWVNRVNERYSYAYRPSDLPVGLYGLESSEPTLAVPNYLVTSGDTPAGVVRDVLRGLFDGRTRLAHDVPAAALLDRIQAIFTGPVPLHPGAIQYFREQRD